MSIRYVGIQRCAKTIVETCANVRPGERVLVVSDFEQTRTIPESVVAAAHALEADVMNINMFPPHPFVRIPQYLKNIMRESDVVFMCTYRAFPFRDRLLVEEILGSGARFLQMHMLTEDIMERTVPVNYDLMEKQASLLSKMLPETNRVELSSPAGTNVTFSCRGRRISLLWDGLCRKSGESDAIPGGLVSISTVEGAANGTVVVDGSMTHGLLGEISDDYSRRMGRIWDPIRLTVKEGRVTQIEGGWMADLLRAKMKASDGNASNFGQFGIGLNPGSKVTGFMLEDERCAGSILVVMGQNKYAGGQTESNFVAPLSLLNATLKLDGKVVVENGSLKI